MKTVALRFSDNFAPACGTIDAHQAVIDQYGYVWYGKLGTSLSEKIIREILNNENPKILLIQSGLSGRFWAYVDNIQRTVPELMQIPQYYRNRSDDFSTWFRVVSFEEAPKGIMSKCTVASSGTVLTNVSMHSMSPYFIINVEE